MTTNTLTILHVAVYTPLTRYASATNALWETKGYLEYLPVEGSDPASLVPGMRIKVPFGSRQLVGIFLRTSHEPTVDHHKLKAAIAVLDVVPSLSPTLMKLAEWASHYYQSSIAEVITNMLPKRLREGALIDDKLCGRPRSAGEPAIPDDHPAYDADKLVLNADQRHAVQTIVSANKFSTFLLEGVTGSGKTEVYLQAIEAKLEQGKQVLVLVPEIALTPQTLGRFKARFPKKQLVALHSALTDKQRLLAWLEAGNGVASIVIGTRSAVFTPFHSLGLIVLDEEHDTSFKQQSRLRYSARDLAIVRAKLMNIPIVLGSATPSLESLHNAAVGRYQRIALPERAGGAGMPLFKVVDLRHQPLKHGLSNALLRAIEARIAKKEQVLLFLNRRGYSPLLMCHTCGLHFECKQCDAHMVLYKRPARLRCHHCNYTMPPPKQCPHCLSTVLITVGVGTEKLSDALVKQFPEANVTQMDGDTINSRTKLQAVLDDIYSGNVQIVVGTQMLAKGHHFPEVTLVAVVDADHGLFNPDFRATERMAQLLLQVAGRAGRAEKPGEVYIQTHHPDHPLLKLLLAQGYPAFARAVLAERHKAVLPPYSRIAALRAEAKTALKASTFLNEVRCALEAYFAQHNDNTLSKVQGPIPLGMQRKAGYYRMQLLFQAPSRQALKKALHPITAIVRAQERKHPGIRWLFDVDPIELF